MRFSSSLKYFIYYSRKYAIGDVTYLNYKCFNGSIVYRDRTAFFQDFFKIRVFVDVYKT